MLETIAIILIVPMWGIQRRDKDRGEMWAVTENPLQNVTFPSGGGTAPTASRLR